MCLADWAKKIGIDRRALSYRLKRWSVGAAMTRKVRPKKRWITHNGRTMCFGDWAKEIGIHRRSLQHRLEHWSIKKALTSEAHMRAMKKEAGA